MGATDAVCLPAKCGKTHRDFYILCYKAFDDVWVETYGRAEIPQDSSGRHGSSISVNMNRIRTGPQYKCPHCGETHKFTCWNCGKRTCFDGDTHDGREVVCAHCGKSGVFKAPSGTGGSSKSDNTITGISVVGQ